MLCHERAAILKHDSVQLRPGNLTLFALRFLRLPEKILVARKQTGLGFRWQKDRILYVGKTSIFPLILITVLVQSNPIVLDFSWLISSGRSATKQEVQIEPRVVYFFHGKARALL